MIKLLLILLLPVLLSSQNIWEVRLDLNGTPEESVIKKIDVIDSNNIYMISTRGTPNFLYKTTDNGDNWLLINDLSKYNAYSACDIEVFDSLIYISYGKGIILKSSNYGESFEKIELEYKKTVDDLIMFDIDVGIANMPLDKYTTLNGWKTSKKIIFPFYLNMTSPKKYKNNKIYSIIFNFGDEIFSDPVYQFAKIDIMNETIESKDIYRMNYNDFEILNDSIFYLCGVKNQITGGSGHDAIFKSTDAGNTWRTVLDLYSFNTKIPNQHPFGLQDIEFKNDSVGIAVGQFGKILYTYDSGNSWFYEQRLPREIDSLSPPTMLVTYAGEQAILGTYTGHVYTLQDDNLAPKPKDTLTLAGKIISEDSLATNNIPIRLNGNRITMTDKGGNYKFTKLSSGTYTVTALNKYFDGENPSFFFEPYLYSPIHEIELKNSISNINFNVENIRGNYEVTGSIILNGEGVEGIEIILKGDKHYVDITDENGFFSFQNIGKWREGYTITP